MTPLRDGYSFGMTPKGTPIRDELRINEDLDIHDNGKLKQSDLRKELHSGLRNLPQPKNEYQIVMQPIPENSEEPEEKIEEDMSDRFAREKAEEEARHQELLKKRSKVLQRELPRPPPASLDQIRNSLNKADEDKSSFVPPTLIEHADEMIRKELLHLLEHDNVKYPPEEKADKDKKKGVKQGKSIPVPEIEDFGEFELKEADNLIKDEAQFLRVAMGHENESLDEFVEAHRTCLNDIMYFPTRNGFGLSSVANNMEKLAALQNEFENVKKRMDDDTKKAQRLEQKIKVLTNGYQMRAGKLSMQIEATFKLMDSAGTELECFQALQKQEQLAATQRISNLWEEVQKQKNVEGSLQKRYGDLLVEQEKVQQLIDAYKEQAKIEEEIAAKNHAIELSKAEAEANRAIELAKAEAEAEAEAEADRAIDLAKAEAEANRAIDLAKAEAEAEAEADRAIELAKAKAEAEAEANPASELAKAEAEAEANCATELAKAEAAVSQTVGPDLENLNSVAITQDISMLVDTTDEMSRQQNAAQEQADLSPKHKVDIDAVDERTTSATGDLPMSDSTGGASLISETVGEPIKNDDGLETTGSVELPSVNENPVTGKSGETSLDEGESLLDMVDTQEKVRSDGSIHGTAEDESGMVECQQDVANEMITDGIVTEQESNVHKTAEDGSTNGDTS